jgi:hypothetical protein
VHRNVGQDLPVEVDVRELQGVAGNATNPIWAVPNQAPGKTYILR